MKKRIWQEYNYSGPAKWAQLTGDSSWEDHGAVWFRRCTGRRLAFNIVEFEPAGSWGDGAPRIGYAEAYEVDIVYTAPNKLAQALQFIGSEPGSLFYDRNGSLRDIEDVVQEVCYALFAYREVERHGHAYHALPRVARARAAALCEDYEYPPSKQALEREQAMLAGMEEAREKARR